MSDIIVQFNPQGDRELVRAIEALQKAKGRLKTTTDKTTKSLGVFDTRTKRNAKSMSSLSLAFSTVRSKMLLFNFAMGLGITQLTKMAQASAKLMDASVTGSGSPLLNGRVTDRPLHGFDLYQSNAIAVGSTGSAATHTFGSSSTSGQTAILYGHMSGVATASHIAKTEVIRDPDSFSDIVRGLHVFGRKVLRGETTTGFKGVFKGLMDLDS